MNLNFFGIILLIFGCCFLLVIFLLFRKKRNLWKNDLFKRLDWIKNQNLPPKYYLLELDKLLEFAFQKKFSKKESLGKILKTKTKTFSKNRLNDIWFAHKIRNKLMHQVDFEISQQDLSRAIEILHKELSNL